MDGVVSEVKRFGQMKTTAVEATAVLGRKYEAYVTILYPTFYFLLPSAFLPSPYSWSISVGSALRSIGTFVGPLRQVDTSPPYIPYLPGRI